MSSGTASSPAAATTQRPRSTSAGRRARRSQRGDGDAGEHRQPEADDQPEARRRAQPGEHRHGVVERRVQPRLRPERRPERQQRQAAVQHQQLAPAIARRDPDAPDAEDQRARSPGNDTSDHSRQMAQHPGVRVRRARQVVAPVGRVLHRVLRARGGSRRPAAASTYGRNAGTTSSDRDDRRRPRPPIQYAPVGPEPAHRRHDEDGEADHQADEHAVVAAADRLRRHRRAERRAAAGAGPVGQAMKREHAERQPGRHQQLDVRRCARRRTDRTRSRSPETAAARRSPVR